MVNFIAQYWLGFAFSVLVGGLGLIWRMLKQKHKQMLDEHKQMLDEQKALKHILVVVLGDMILREYSVWHENGSICLEDLRRIQSLYEYYSSLGGNGAVKAVMEKLNEISINSFPRSK